MSEKVAYKPENLKGKAENAVLTDYRGIFGAPMILRISSRYKWYTLTVRSYGTHTVLLQVPTH